MADEPQDPPIGTAQNAADAARKAEQIGALLENRRHREHFRNGLLDGLDGLPMAWPSQNAEYAEGYAFGAELRAARNARS